MQEDSMKMYLYTYNKLTKSNIETVSELPQDWADFFNSVREDDIQRYWILSLLKSKKSASKVSILTGIKRELVNNIYINWGMRLASRLIPEKFIKL
jgi:hypothetical protein